MEKRYFVFIDFRSGEFEKYKSKGMIERKFANETQYLYINSTWIEIDMYKNYEGCMMLAKLPMPPFEELVQIFENSRIEEEIIGSVSIILNKHLESFIEKMDDYINCNYLDKKIVKKIKYLKKNIYEDSEELIGKLKKNREEQFQEIRRKIDLILLK